MTIYRRGPDKQCGSFRARTGRELGSLTSVTDLVRERAAPVEMEERRCARRGLNNNALCLISTGLGILAFFPAILYLATKPCVTWAKTQQQQIEERLEEEPQTRVHQETGVLEHETRNTFRHQGESSNPLTSSVASVGPTHPSILSFPMTPLASTTDANSIILSVINTMPKGGGYAASREATENLQKAISRSGSQLAIAPRLATPSYCSGATYLVFLQAVQALTASNKSVDVSVSNALLVKGQCDGSGIWGRWNANGPGTACLFHELQLGHSFISWESAKPGDFMKIFWNYNVGIREHGHSAVFLGLTKDVNSGKALVRFWSSNQDTNGFGERQVPREKIFGVIFSRLEYPENVQRNLATLPRLNTYLASLLSADSSLSEALQKAGIAE